MTDSASTIHNVEPALDAVETFPQPFELSLQMSPVFHVAATVADQTANFGLNAGQPTAMLGLRSHDLIQLGIETTEMDKDNVVRFCAHAGKATTRLTAPANQGNFPINHAVRGHHVDRRGGASKP